MNQNTLPITRDDITVMANEKEIPVLMRPAKRSTSRVLPIAFTAVAVLYLLFSLRNPFIYYYKNSSAAPSAASSSVPTEHAKALVPLEAHIMSKCSDTQVRALKSL